MHYGQHCCQYNKLTTPGVEPGLSRPERDVLTTRRCGHLTGIKTLIIIARKRATNGHLAMYTGAVWRAPLASAVSNGYVGTAFPGLRGKRQSRRGGQPQRRDRETCIEQVLRAKLA